MIDQLRYEVGEVFVSTVKAFDTNRYETAVEHPEYNNGKLIVVEEYDNKAAAQVGQLKWIEIMTAEVLPEVLIDRSTCMIKVFGDFLEGDNERHIHHRQVKE